MYHRQSREKKKRIKFPLFLRHNTTMVQNNRESRREYWATCSTVPSFTCSTHLNQVLGTARFARALRCTLLIACLLPSLLTNDQCWKIRLFWTIVRWGLSHNTRVERAIHRRNEKHVSKARGQFAFHLSVVLPPRRARHRMRTVLLFLAWVLFSPVDRRFFFPQAIYKREMCHFPAYSQI